MRRLRLIVILLMHVLMLAIITACSYGEATGTSNDDNIQDQGHDLLSNWKGLHMYVAEGSVTPTGLRLSMINSSDLNFGHGVMFSIQQYQQGQWGPASYITDSIAWILPLLNVAPYTTVDENISWEHMHGQLPPGQYRIVRNFMELDWLDPTPMWERDIPEYDLYAVFVIGLGDKDVRSAWLMEQEALAATAFARFAGLDLKVIEYSPRGLSFMLANNNPYYTYVIDGVFVGWEENFGGSMEYMVYSPGFTNPSWPFEEGKKLAPGEYIALELDWYYAIGSLPQRTNVGTMWHDRENPYLFGLTVMVALDVSDEYIRENFSHHILGMPGISYRIVAEFDLAR